MSRYEHREHADFAPRVMSVTIPEGVPPGERTVPMTAMCYTLHCLIVIPKHKYTISVHHLRRI